MARKNNDYFYLKQFSVRHDRCAHKVGTDGVLLGAWADITGSKRILDVGTGSGIIALMLAQRSQPATHIDAIDISAADCDQAKENVSASPWPSKVVIQNTSLQTFESQPYDLIVSNPPFFTDSAKPPSEERTRARHTESLPLVVLIEHAQRLLAKDGKLSLILPTVEGQRFITHATSSGWHCTRLCEFRSRANKPVERLLIQLQLKKHDLIKESLILYKYEAGEEWTDHYKTLTRDFYLKI
jgi:tRNA1Val (adenine37-N6)-methyltransferase